MSEMKDFLFPDNEEEAPRENTEREHFSYNAKVCELKWFLTADIPQDYKDILAYHKYKADYFYRKKQYEAGYKEYEKLVELMPSKNTYLLLDIFECQVRCLVHLPDPPADPVQLAKHMMKVFTNDTQFLNCLLLLQYVYHELNMPLEEVHILQRCLVTHYQNADLWTKLAEAYQRLLGSDNSHKSQKKQSINDKDLNLKGQDMRPRSASDQDYTEQRLNHQASTYENLHCSSSGNNQDFSDSPNDCTRSEPLYATNIYDKMKKCALSGGKADDNEEIGSSKETPELDLTWLKKGECAPSETEQNNQNTSTNCHPHAEDSKESCCGSTDIQLSTNECNSPGHEAMQCLGTGMPGVQVVLVCLLRARNILKICERDLVGLGLERNIRQQERVLANIDALNVEEDAMQKCERLIYCQQNKLKKYMSTIDARDESCHKEFESLLFTELDERGDEAGNDTVPEQL